MLKRRGGKLLSQGGISIDLTRGFPLFFCTPLKGRTVFI